VSLEKFQNIYFHMDVAVIHIPDSWGLLLSNEWVTKLGGSTHADLSYVTIPTSDGDLFFLHPEAVVTEQIRDKKAYHIRSLFWMKELTTPISCQIPSSKMKKKWMDVGLWNLMGCIQVQDQVLE
jgi:hypothetical protein